MKGFLLAGCCSLAIAGALAQSLPFPGPGGVVAGGPTCQANTDNGAYSNVMALYHYENSGTDNGAAGTHTGTLYGGATFDTIAGGGQVKFGVYSGKGASAGGMNIGHASGLVFTGDLTFETWIYLTTVSPNYGWFGDGGNTIAIYPGAVSTTQWTYRFTGSPDNSFTYTTPTGVWTHQALVRSGTTVTLYADGVSKGTFTDTRTAGSSVNDLNLLATYPANANYWVRGWQDETRISNVARYTSNFTPYTLPFCNS